MVYLRNLSSVVELELPKICVKVGGERKLCYTCWKRSLAFDYKIGSVVVNGVPGFNYINF